MSNAGNAAPGFEKYPDYEVTIEPADESVAVSHNGTELINTDNALLVTESRHHPVWYLPMAEVNPQYLQRSDHETYCPFKGTASYWHVDTGEAQAENAVWGYETPYQECEALIGYVSFYADKVDIKIGTGSTTAAAPGWTDR